MEPFRELYKQKYDAQLRVLRARLELLHAQAEKNSVQARLDLVPYIAIARTRLEAAGALLASLTDAEDDTASSTRRDAELAGTRLKEAIDNLEMEL